MSKLYPAQTSDFSCPRVLHDWHFENFVFDSTPIEKQIKTCLWHVLKHNNHAETVDSCFSGRTDSVVGDGPFLCKVETPDGNVFIRWRKVGADEIAQVMTPDMWADELARRLVFIREGCARSAPFPEIVKAFAEAEDLGFGGMDDVVGLYSPLIVQPRTGGIFIKSGNLVGGVGDGVALILGGVANV